MPSTNLALSPTLSTETIFSHYAPIERYSRQLKASLGSLAKPAFAVNGLDVYLMHMLAAMSPSPTTVIDLTGAVTLGAVTFSWLYQAESIHHLIVGQTDWQGSPLPWQSWLSAAIETNGLSPKNLTVLDAPIDSADALNVNPLSPQIVVIAQIGTGSAEIAERLRRAIEVFPQAAIMIGPLGTIGDSALLSVLIGQFSDQGAHHFAALREVSPFFANAQFGVLYPRENEHIPLALKRLHDLYDGNFGYLTLLAQNYALHEQSQRTQSQTVSLSSANGDSASSALIAAKSGGARLQLLTRQSRNLAVRTIKTIRRKPDPYHVSYMEVTVPNQFQVGQFNECRVVLRNDSTLRWTVIPGTVHGFNMSYHWLSKDGLVIAKEGQRTPIPTLDPGQSTSVDFSVAAPGEPGTYILELDAVYEGFSWFSDATGVHGPRFTLNVIA